MGDITVRAAAYCRISKDDSGLAAGVSRQEEDCRALAARRGWDIAQVYVDNDISAWKGRPRPAYAQMLTDISNGHVTAVIVWALDRLHRRPLELEGYLATCERAGLTRMACVSGDIDLATSEGRLVARMMAAVDAKASDDASRRIRRALTARASQGLPAGRRSFGYTEDQMSIDPAEAAAVQQIAEWCLAGDGWETIARRLNTAGVPTVRGGRWAPGTVRQIMANPSIAGLRRSHGEIVGTAAWPPIIDRTTWQRLNVRLSDPETRRLHPAKRRLLSGLVTCGRCGCWMGYAIAGGSPKRRVSCRARPDTDHCGRCSIVADTAEQFVTNELLEQMVQVGPPSGGPLPEVDTSPIDARRRELAKMWAGGELTRADWAAARAELDEQMRTAQAAVSAHERVTVDTSGWDGRPSTVRAWWDGLSLDQQRKVMAAMVDRITVTPVGHRGGSPIPVKERVQIVWR